jgi:hypothetical protein
MSLSCFVQDMEWRGICRHIASKYALRLSLYPFTCANHGDWETSAYFRNVLRKVSLTAQSCALRAFPIFVSAGGRA